ncbi:plasmid partitioning protein RepA [Pseudovibrio brasiliensis]|uniref:Plasmid partitioning protein RepA n=1 Tax=Pseudovibrio brasiliensis TaxID=1898042 RepID=A0ABX8AVD7_9HYPH|nr:plasmid partitioning protein RepA [Pseudovibrio brasiliensis]QUS59030.1 plasmid partitioning protein RepA [Pseudovibrio brasiliensis]
MSGIAIDSDSSNLSPAQLVREQADMLSAQLSAIREINYPPSSQKTMRVFNPQEAAKLLGISGSTLRGIEEDKFREFRRDERNNRTYSLENLWEVRKILSESGTASKWRKLLPTRSNGEKLQVLCVANFKGGSAKTTSATHLSQYLALQGLRVLVIDLDPQASLSSMFGLQPDLDLEQNATLYAAIRYDDERVPIRSVIRKTYFHNLDLIPANLELMEYEHQTPSAISSGAASGDEIFFRSIHNAVQDVADDYDVVIFDAPPQLGYLTLGALFAATGVLVTVHPAMLDVSSMNQFLNMLADLMQVIEENGGEMDLDFFRYLLTRHNPNDNPQIRCAALLRSLFPDNVLRNAVVESTAIANAGLENKSIYEIERGAVGRQTLERGLESVNAVNNEMFDLIKAAWGRDD